MKTNHAMGSCVSGPVGDIRSRQPRQRYSKHVNTVWELKFSARQHAEEKGKCVVLHTDMKRHNQMGFLGADAEHVLMHHCLKNKNWNYIRSYCSLTGCDMRYLNVRSGHERVSWCLNNKARQVALSYGLYVKKHSCVCPNATCLFLSSSTWVNFVKWYIF